MRNSREVGGGRQTPSISHSAVRQRARAASVARSRFLGSGVVLAADRAAARVLGGRFGLRIVSPAVARADRRELRRRCQHHEVFLSAAVSD